MMTQNHSCQNVNASPCLHTNPHERDKNTHHDLPYLLQALSMPCVVFSSSLYMKLGTVDLSDFNKAISKKKHVVDDKM